MSNFWAIVAILGIVLEVYGFLITIKPKRQRGRHIVLVLFASLIIFTGFAVFTIFSYKNKISNVKEKIVEKLRERSMTADELTTVIFPPDFSVVSEALNDLTADNVVGNNIVDVYDVNRDHYRIRVFYLKNKKQ